MPDDDRETTRRRVTGARCGEIIENIHEIVWVFSPAADRLLYVNPAFEHVTGIPIDRVYDDPRAWREAVHPDDRDRVEEELRAVGGHGHNLEFRLVVPDGAVRWLWARGRPLRDAAGTVSRIIGVAEDISERKRAEEALERSLALLRATLDATADGILALDRQGRLTLFNQRLAELWRMPEFSAIQSGDERDLWAHLREQLEEPDRLADWLREARERPEAHGAAVLELKDGRVFDLSSRPERIGERIVGRVWSFRDTTGRTHAERELRERNRRLQLQSRMLVQLARRRIADPADLRAALEHITPAAAKHLETERAGIWLFDEARERILAYELYERSVDRHSRGAVLVREEAPGYFAALEDERALALSDVSTDPRTRELATSYCLPLGITSMLDVPIRVGGALRGVVCFEQVGRPRRWTVEDESFAGSIGDLVSLTLETAERHRAEGALRVLAEASAVLASSFDYHGTLRDVARLTIPLLADWCVVDVLESGEIRRLASAHREREKEPLLLDLERRYPPTPDSGLPAGSALRTGRPDLVADVTDEVLAARAVDAEHARLIRELGARSFLAVPLIAQEGTLGAITFASADRSYDSDDLAWAQDIARRIAIAVENARLYERADQANAAKSNFLAVMSHELRTPLAAIVGYAGLLEMGIPGPLNAAQREQVGRIQLRSKDLLRVVEEILAFSHTETGTARPELRDVDIPRLVEEMSEIVRPMAAERGLDFQARTPGPARRLRTDPTLLKHVLLDLLSNAIKFTERGAVSLDASTGDARAVFSVSDTGIGIDPGDQERIFEPFVQVEEAMTREKGGTGLGLAVARRLARLLGGDVTVVSTPGEGTTFTVELPLQPEAGMGWPAPGGAGGNPGGGGADVKERSASPAPVPGRRRSDRGS